MKHYPTLAATILITLLAACGTSPANTNPPPPPPPPVGSTQVGSINLQVLGNSVLALARFESYSPGLSSPPSGAFPNTNICVVSSGAVPPALPTPPSNPGVGIQITSLDGGPQVTIKKASGTHGTLEKRTEGSEISYVGPNLPFTTETLKADIPGVAGGFANFNDVPLPTLPASFDFSTNPADPINKDTSFTWTNPMGASTQMLFMVVQGNSSNYKVVYCIVADTGSFSFPAQTKTEMQTIGLNAGSLFLAMRISSHTETRGNNHVVVTAMRTKFF